MLRGEWITQVIDGAILQSPWINRIDGIVPRICVEIDSATVTDRIPRDKTTCRGIIVAMSEQLQPCFIVGVVTKLGFVSKWIAQRRSKIAAVRAEEMIRKHAAAAVQ